MQVLVIRWRLITIRAPWLMVQRCGVCNALIMQPLVRNATLVSFGSAGFCVITHQARLAHGRPEARPDCSGRQKSVSACRVVHSHLRPVHAGDSVHPVLGAPDCPADHSRRAHLPVVVAPGEKSEMEMACSAVGELARTGACGAGRYCRFGGCGSRTGAGMG